jgi:hypothetical protein
VSPAPKNPRNLTELGALRVLKPDEWAKRIRRAVKDADGSLDDASAALGISRRTLQRWLASDERLAEARDRVAGRIGRPPAE